MARITDGAQSYLYESTVIPTVAAVRVDAECGNGKVMTSASVDVLTGVPDAPSIIATSATEGSIMVTWLVAADTFRQQVSSYRVERNGTLSKTLPLNLQQGETEMSWTIEGLRASTPYSVQVLAQNTFGLSKPSVVHQGTAAKDCTAAVDMCPSPEQCGNGYKLVKTDVPGACCTSYDCVCDLSTCTQPRPTCTGDTVLVTKTDLSSPCCPDARCVLWNATCEGASGRCTCPVGRAGARCELDNPTNAPCGPDCLTCNQVQRRCIECTNSQYLLNGYCANCPELGFDQVGTHKTAGRRCLAQQPCTFQHSDGGWFEYAHNQKWCDGPQRVCSCLASQIQCTTRTCVGGPTASTASVRRTTMSITNTLDADRTTTTTTTTTTTGVAITPAPVHGGWSKWSPYSKCTGEQGAVSLYLCTNLPLKVYLCTLGGHV